jgi:O-antigen/teichoic acid export membrane protein
VLGLVLGLLLVRFNAPTAAAVLEGYALAQLVSILIALPRLGFGQSPRLASPTMIDLAVRYGMPLVLGGIFVWLANNGIRFVVEWQAGAAAVGLITVGWGLGQRAAAFAAMLVTAAAFPIAVKRAREDGIAAGQAQLVNNGVLLLAALAPAAVGLWVVAGPLVKLFIAEPYREMTMAVLPLSIVAGALRNFRIHFGEQVFLLREETRVPLVTDAVDGLTTIIGVAAGLYIGGLPGAVAGAAAGAFFSLLVTLWCGYRWHRFCFPLGDLVRILLAVWAMSLAVRMMPVPPTTFGLGSAVIVGAIVYVIVMALLYPDRARRALAMIRSIAPGRGGTA